MDFFLSNPTDGFSLREFENMKFLMRQLATAGNLFAQLQRI